jgi:hypothetical protein
MMCDKDGNIVIDYARFRSYYQIFDADNPSIIYLRLADLTRKGRTLWKKIDLTGHVSSNTINVDLRYGDVDGNNVINLSAVGSSDFTYWSARDGARVQMEHSNPATTSTYKYDIGADLNRDRIVDQLDSTILSNCQGTNNVGDALNQ